MPRPATMRIKRMGQNEPTPKKYQQKAVKLFHFSFVKTTLFQDTEKPGNGQAFPGFFVSFDEGFFCNSSTKASIAAHFSGGRAIKREMKRFRKESSASDMISVTSRASSSFALRWTYISPSPSSSQASETLNSRQISEIVRSVGTYVPEHIRET